MPKYDELSIVAQYPKFKGDKKLMAYMPDKLPKGRYPSYDYWYNCLHTLYPEYVKEMIRQAQSNRHEVAQASLQDGVIRVTDDWWQMLNEVPFTSGKHI